MALSLAIRSLGLPFREEPLLCFMRSGCVELLLSPAGGRKVPAGHCLQVRQVTWATRHIRSNFLKDAPTPEMCAREVALLVGQGLVIFSKTNCRECAKNRPQKVPALIDCANQVAPLIIANRQNLIFAVIFQRSTEPALD